MESRSIKEKIRKILAEIGARAGAHLRLSDFHEREVKVTYYKEPSTCPVKIGGAGPPRAEREIILEVLEEQPKVKIPEIKWIIVE